MAVHALPNSNPMSQGTGDAWLGFPVVTGGMGDLPDADSFPRDVGVLGLSIDEGWGASKESSGEVLGEVPLEVPGEGAVEVPVAVPLEMPGEGAVEVPGVVPVEVLGEVPVEVPVDVSSKVLVKVPVDVPVEVLVQPREDAASLSLTAVSEEGAAASGASVVSASMHALHVTGNHLRPWSVGTNSSRDERRILTKNTNKQVFRTFMNVWRSAVALSF
jgi:hypothetical protein